MHIKKLEIAGFKSFVDRTVIHFDHDVVGVVGPNGCGKSNIVDAIRWCMGEQSAKHLRGRSMEDVIFNGSESRGPHGLAEVTLTFDNSDASYAESLPPEYRDYPEIAVTRRLFRDGTSEYLINKTQVRLRDVTDLFLGTGVGTKAYSIVEQGRIGQIVSSRPEDRRLFIEEAAGITKYKLRRKQAERKMELTRQNLLRVTDIVAEIDRNRAALKRQVAKAERYLQYRSELEELTLHEASHRLLELIVVERVDRDGLTAASAAAESLRERLTSAEATLEVARREALAIEARADYASREAFEADNEVSTLHADIERSRDRLGHLSERLTNDGNERDEIIAWAAQRREEHAALEARLGTLEADERARLTDAESEDESLAGLRERAAEAAEELGKLRLTASEATTRAATTRARIEALAERLVELHGRRERLTAEQDTLTGEESTLTARRHALGESVRELAEGKRLTAADRETLERELAVLRASLLDSERAVDSAKNALGLKRNRLRALEDLHRRLEGVGAGARALLSRSDPAVVGMVADRIEAPEELTSAFAGLLGERLQYVVVADASQGLELLAELKRSARGRAHVVPARPRYVAGGVRRAALDDPAARGLIIDRLDYAPEDAALVRALVGDTILVDSGADALALVSRHPEATAVALDGTVVRPDGVVSGGSGDDVAAAMIEQKREMRGLTEEVERLSVEESRLVTAHNALRARLAEVGTALDRAREGAHVGELALVNAEKDLARTESELGRAQARLRALGAELEGIDASHAGACTDEQTSRDELDRLSGELEHIQHELTRAEERARDWKDQVEAQAALVTERKVRLAQVREQIGAARQETERLAQAITDLETRAARLDADMLEAARGYGETAARILLAREARGLASTTAAAAHRELETARADLETMRHSLGAQEAELKLVRDELTIADEHTRKHELSLQRLGLEREHLLASVREKFRGLHLPSVVGTYHARPSPDAEHRRRIEELTQLIDRMGPVSLDAAEEHAVAERRFHELNDQKLDIEKALDELEKAIKHMDRESRRRFKETFESVNELFKKTFSKLFRGGRAELVLTNPDDLLSSGVEVIAQPPGKKLGNIELMSGGEKALTAVSLIFSMFQHRPSPFCILDEVDAPLDEANVARYNEAIRSMTDKSQFILITHIKKTMQLVDVLYGVTMGEPGVSRIVSVKVNENAVARSDSHGHALDAAGAGARSTQVA
ncbi:MAG: chromosome segregation protein SMC [Sorangiineae bacterium]|nr:chromosome segregation protein SMC [Polyangiaceae bacterium]MEB2324625.1 chromosome segregation protein SMC [Sorangiineae bacterium]